ncbi:MAG: hypothetical protein ACP5LH_00490 [Candidatus Micrarchaeia archaeon]
MVEDKDKKEQFNEGKFNEGYNAGRGAALRAIESSIKGATTFNNVTNIPPIKRKENDGIREVSGNELNNYSKKGGIVDLSNFDPSFAEGYKKGMLDVLNKSNSNKTVEGVLREESKK